METTRERILAVSEELFRRQGMTGTGLKQILQQAEAPFGSLYHHFPGGKDELAVATVASAGARYGASVAVKLGDPSPDAPRRVRDCFADAAETLRGSDYADACPIETLALEVASTNERLRVATADVFEGWVENLATWLGASGVPQGRCRHLALAILSLLEGAFVLARAGRSPDPVLAAGDAASRLVAAEMSATDPGRTDGVRPSRNRGGQYRA